MGIGLTQSTLKMGIPEVFGYITVHDASERAR
jgi:hypothetical protein